MRLEPLCEMKLSYRKEDAYGAEFVEMHPNGGDEGSGYGEGEATLTGQRLTGTARWANHPHILGDGMVQPNVHGIITTHDGALVLFSLTGRTLFLTPKADQLLRMTFEAEDQRYRWLNSAFCVLEGVGDVGFFRTKVYVCINELAEGT